jgi:hypothetical protein
MTVRNLFQGVMARVLSNVWGTRIKDADGKKRDTGVDPAMQEVAAILNAATVLDGPVVIRNSTDGPGLVIENDGPRNQNSGVSVRNQQGQVTDLGIGLGNMNIIANAVIPLASSEVNPLVAHLFLTKGETPTNAILDYYGVNVPDSDPSTVNSGQTTGTGAPYIGGVPVGGAIDPTTPTTLPTNPMNPESQGNPFNLHPVIPLTAALLNGLSNGALFEAGCGITITKTNNKYTVAITPATLAGSGLTTSSTCTLDVNVGCGVEINSDAVRVKRADLIEANKGLKAGSGTCDIAVDVDGVTTQINSNQLSTKGVTGDKTVVTAVSCNAGTLSVTTETWTLTRGVVTSIA